MGKLLARQLEGKIERYFIYPHWGGLVFQQQLKEHVWTLKITSMTESGLLRLIYHRHGWSFYFW